MNYKHIKNVGTQAKEEKTNKGQIRIDRGDKTYQGRPGTDQGQAGTDQGQSGTDQGQPGTEQG